MLFPKPQFISFIKNRAMKHFPILLALLTAGLCQTSCNQHEEKKVEPQETLKATEDSTTLKCNSIQTGKLKTYTLDELAPLENNYRELIYASYKNVTRQMIFDPGKLMELACESDSLKFIYIADKKQVSMAVMRASDKKINFYDLLDIFGKNALCPPPDACGIPVPELSKADTSSTFCDSVMSKYKPIDSGRIAEMAALYLQRIKDDYREYIQQVRLEPKLLQEVLCGAQSLKLIAAVRADKAITMIIQKGYAGKHYYYDIREIFGDYALCPPPEGCGIPFTKPAKK